MTTRSDDGERETADIQRAKREDRDLFPPSEDEIMFPDELLQWVYKDF